MRKSAKTARLVAQNRGRRGKDVADLDKLYIVAVRQATPGRGIRVTVKSVARTARQARAKLSLGYVVGVIQHGKVYAALYRPFRALPARPPAPAIVVCTCDPTTDFALFLYR